MNGSINPFAAIVGLFEMVITGKQDERGKKLHMFYRVLLVLMFVLIIVCLIVSCFTYDSVPHATGPNAAITSNTARGVSL